MRGCGFPVAFFGCETEEEGDGAFQGRVCDVAENLRHAHDGPNASNVGEGCQKGRFSLEAAQKRHGGGYRGSGGKVAPQGVFQGFDVAVGVGGQDAKGAFG